MKRQPSTRPDRSATAPLGWGFVILIFLSGFAALIYQILWMRQLGLVFGNTSHAAAMTLAMFFGGLACGSWFWGRLSGRLAKPLHAYGLLELGVAAGGLLCLLLLPVYRGLYPALHQQFETLGLWSAKALLAGLVVVPPSFLMGGTLPLLGRHLIERQEGFGRITAAIYGFNTLGAACGAFAAAFLMLPAFGFRASCIVAVGISLGVAVLALLLGRRAGRIAAAPAPAAPAESAAKTKAAADEQKAGLPRILIRLMAVVSGFNVLALEVLWTRMFAQVHENSVYSFAAVLIVVLLALAAGAWLASRLAARSAGALPTLPVLCVLCGLAVCIVPFSFNQLTDGLTMLPEHGSFAVYVLQLFATALGAVGPSCLLLGTLFPFLMKGEERYASQPGRSIGSLTALNTGGAILGSLICGFILLEWLGMWRSMQLLAALYLLLGLLLPARGRGLVVAARVSALAVLLLAFSWLDPTRLPVTGLDPNQGRQKVVERWEASDCTVTVVRKANGEHAIRVNSNYSLGSSEAYMSQIYQTRVPLLAWPETRSVFYLGMGTGMTAGEALDRKDFPQIEEVVVCELSASVAEAAYKYFGGSPGRPDLCNGLFKDPRATVLVEDGRNHLMASPASYDMINADLFLPYRSGSGSLYSLEHFQTVRSRLKPGGVFVQWLPLYQLSEREFGIITRTMLEAFGRVTMWRCHFQPGAETIALVGHQDDAPLPPCTLDAGSEQRAAVRGADYNDMGSLRLPVNSQTILLFYCGNLSGVRQRFEAYPLNTDDRPLIEYGTPRSLHRSRDGERPHFVGEKFVNLVDEVLAATPPQDDPVLASRSAASRQLPLAGADYQRAWLAVQQHDSASHRKYWQAFLGKWLASAAAGDAGALPAP